MRKNNKTRLVSLFLALILILAFSGCDQGSSLVVPTEQSQTAVNETGRYTAPEDVAAYLHTYHQLPVNFITKKKAMALGWASEQGNLWDVTDGLSIGGDIFGNREGLLPKKAGRIWYECDVNYQGGFRGAERVVYSNDGLIYYTNDHYQTFSRLY